ncbi:MAG: aminotransferase class I/II-fold pyridoxal phosphate-dependent enzyme [Bacteroidales bacterium]|nr:aminotransferase class I/II-fold pyridoxal phosphate-dependent enzyme [Bacteroidales bacterium]MBN2757441.1 aminotransferase class I/II-fold pyridoxal phosphate-dependent enzyme [Bacteroidales bacterium]
MKTKIWLSSPHMSGNEKKYVNEAFDTNWVAPLGPNVNNFEKELSEYLKISDVAALSSGTAALHLALIILGVAQGDEVICSSFTFSASANPIVYQGAIPIFIDSEEDTWNMDSELLETAIKDRISKGKKPKAIILVHLYGMPAKIDKIFEIANKYEIPIIEDAAEALGSKYKNKACGTFGKLGILSFNGNKIITTSGGGALISDNKEYIEKARFLATQARDNAPHYQHSNIGYNYRMSNIVAGIGRGQLEVLNNRIDARRKNNLFYQNLMSEINGISFLKELNSDFYSNFWLTTIVINQKHSNTTSEKLRLEFEKENIETRPLWKPMHIQPIFEKYPKYLNGVSEKLFQNGLCLPSGSNLTENDKERISEVIIKNLK